LTVNKADGEQSFSVIEGSLLQKVLDSEAVEARTLNIIGFLSHLILYRGKGN
jgi:hypothetical protein